MVKQKNSNKKNKQVFNKKLDVVKEDVGDVEASQIINSNKNNEGTKNNVNNADKIKIKTDNTAKNASSVSDSESRVAGEFASASSQNPNQSAEDISAKMERDASVKVIEYYDYISEGITINIII